MIRLEAVSKFFDDKVAVDRVDLEIPAGSVFGLIGPNGAGKTTTLRMLSTLVKPDAGRITVDGLVLEENVRELRPRIGYMPDSFGGYRGLTCAEYLQFFGRAYGQRGPELAKRVTGVLELTDLGGMRDELASALSTGVRQRLSLAKTLINDPRILVLDEPASGLDPRARIEIRSLLKELGRMGKTLVISSHILADLQEICTYVGIIEQGKLVWSGPLKTLADATREGQIRAIIQVAQTDGERAAALLRPLEFVSGVQVSSGRLEVEMRGRHGNRTLETLTSGGIEVISFSLEDVNLEALFLARTRGVIS